MIAGRPMHEVLDLASRRLRASREELFEALEGELSPTHCFVLNEMMMHIEQIEAQMARFDAYLMAQLADSHNILDLLQTLPGVDRIGAAMLLVEIGGDMSAFGTPDRLASWAGVCPGNNESAGKRKSGKARKAILTCGYANLPKRQGGRHARSNLHLTRLSYAEGTSAQSTPSPTKCYAPSFSCCSGTNATGTVPPTTKR